MCVVLAEPGLWSVELVLVVVNPDIVNAKFQCQLPNLKTEASFFSMRKIPVAEFSTQ